MSGTEPGADELRMKALLKKHRVGPANWWEPAETPFAEDTPDDEPDDVTPDDEDDDEEPTGRFTPQPGYWPRPHMPAVVDRVRDRTPAAISPATRAFLYNASAAGTGWALGLYGKFAWALDDCGREQGIGAAIVLGAVGTVLIAHVWDRRTRHWWPGIAWAARIPLATALLALALWAPAAT
jgi:hypothetical protein